MKIPFLIFVIAAVTVAGWLRAAEPAKEPVVTLEPFEPPLGECWNLDDKFSHPTEIVAPKFLYPFEMRRAAIDGEVGVLVQINERGYAKRLSILYSTLNVFSNAAIRALKQAQWKAEPNRHGRMDTWFYYKVVYRIDEKPNQ